MAMSYTAFLEFRRIATGTETEVVSVLRDRPQGQILIFEDATGTQVDLDPRGTVGAPVSGDAVPAETRGRGRPRLGVVPREVTLLPRHWDWLNSQPGGASVALRRLVDEARKSSGDRDRVRAAQEAAYRFTSAVAGNLPGFEEAARALFAYDRRRFATLVSDWPEDVRDYAMRLAFADQESQTT
jgi:hypothetical protein